MDTVKTILAGVCVILLVALGFRGCVSEWQPLQPKAISVEVPIPPVTFAEMPITRDTVRIPVADSATQARLRRALHERDSLRSLLAAAGVQTVVSVDTVTTAGDSLRLEYDEISRRFLFLSLVPSPRSVLYQPPPLPSPLASLGALYQCPPPPSTFDNVVRWVLPSVAAGITAGYLIR